MDIFSKQPQGPDELSYRPIKVRGHDRDANGRPYYLEIPPGSQGKIPYGRPRVKEVKLARECGWGAVICTQPWRTPGKGAWAW